MSIDPSPAHGPRRSWLSRLRSFVFAQLFALAMCVGFPALVTAIAPVSWVSFERHDGQVSAAAQTCLLFVIPYKNQTVSPVTGIGDRLVAGTVTSERRAGRDRATKSEDEGFLIIRGNNHDAEVPVTPFNLKSVIERSEAFLRDASATELKLFVVANWKFSVIAGGLISLLTVLYVVGVTYGVLLKAANTLRWALSISSKQQS